jgi:hypothetical protein
MDQTLIVCGGRCYSDAARIAAIIGAYIKPGVRLVVHHGDATGADTLAGLFCASARIRCIPHPAAWETHDPDCASWCRAKRYCERAGTRRNAEMLAAVLASAEPTSVTVVAFPGGSGTANMVKIAKKKGCKIAEVPPG